MNNYITKWTQKLASEHVWVYQYLSAYPKYWHHTWMAISPSSKNAKKQ